MTLYYTCTLAVRKVSHFSLSRQFQSFQPGQAVSIISTCAGSFNHFSLSRQFQSFQPAQAVSIISAWAGSSNHFSLRAGTVVSQGDTDTNLQHQVQQAWTTLLELCMKVILLILVQYILQTIDLFSVHNIQNIFEAL